MHVTGRPYASKSRAGGPCMVVVIAPLPFTLEFGVRFPFHARVRGSFPTLGGLKETKMFPSHPLLKFSIVGSLCDQEVACSASDLQDLNFESYVWRTVSSHDPQKVLLAQFSLYV